MSKKIDLGSDKDFIANYIKLKSSRKMGELYGCSKKTILKHAKEIGFDVHKNQNPPKLSEEDKKRIISLYNEKTSSVLAEEYNVSRGMITKLWYDAGLRGKEIKPAIRDDLSGKKINNLFVIEPTENRTSSGSVMYRCKCDCGKICEVDGSRLRSGMAKSCGCLSKKALEKGRVLKNDLTGKMFGKLTVIKRVENKYNQVRWLCKCECGRKTEVMAVNLRENGGTQSCGLCRNNSHGNIKVEKILKDANIPFVREKRFDTCKDINALPFDFYVDNKYLIEYDGRQHFIEESFFDSEKIKKHDKIKNQWCKDNNIPLIRIPYTQYKELALEDLLLETTRFLV